MWERHPDIHIFHFAYWLDRASYFLNNGRRDVILTRAHNDINNFLARAPIHLSFTVKEESLGLERLQKMGLDDSAPFICFHARDSLYLNKIAPHFNWHYHDFRDSKIHNYIPAAEELVHRGYFMIRMGAVVKEALNTTNPRIIDYATNYRTDFLDIYLPARCRFFLGSPAGIVGVSMIFRKPAVFTNCATIEHIHSWYPFGLNITKKFWLRKERRFLSFREILDSGIGSFQRSEEYEDLGIEVIENTPEEITDVAIEMDERLEGTWKTNEEDEELQQRFWALFKSSKLHGKILARIGTKFLLQNRELLE